ncbi:hypothetical protein JMY07_10620 [Burkholderia thailandensis]|uniref:hypothetical protein n=1 Tax=Burkholderia thailandensis TaxID=57975 RepID=UPI00192D256B|nr:hypothetical protein [Burkholderia thailandensis]QRA09892.1 hypothetical protein JMY07_10620 [Burkholderia thailandensis]
MRRARIAYALSRESRFPGGSGTRAASCSRARRPDIERALDRVSGTMRLISGAGIRITITGPARAGKPIAAVMRNRPNARRRPANGSFVANPLSRIERVVDLMFPTRRRASGGTECADGGKRRSCPDAARCARDVPSRIASRGRRAALCRPHRRAPGNVSADSASAANAR